MAFKAGIFDLDGVVVDTVPLHFEAWRRMFSEYGHPFTFEDYKLLVDGIPRLDGARAILKELTSEELKRAADRKQSYFIEALHAETIPVYDTTVALIGEMKSAGKKVAVISSSRNCPDILRRIDLFDRLDTVVSGADIERGKPDPQIFLMAAERVGVSPAESLVVEDAVLGVEAARRAGMRCAGIDRYGDPGRLSGADIIVADAGELSMDRIESLFKAGVE